MENGQKRVGRKYEERKIGRQNKEVRILHELRIACHDLSNNNISFNSLAESFLREQKGEGGTDKIPNFYR